MKKIVLKFIVFSAVFMGITSSGDSQEIRKNSLSKDDSLTFKKTKTDTISTPSATKTHLDDEMKEDRIKDSIIEQVEYKITNLSDKQRYLNRLYIQLNRKIHENKNRNEYQE